MYDEVEYKVNWFEKFRKGLVIVLIIFILGICVLLLIPKNKQVNYFEDNFQTMISVAKNYYKDSNNMEKLTLKEMVNKKMLIEFVDENGEYCDVNNSYAKISNNKIEVFLKCPSNEQKAENYI